MHQCSLFVSGVFVTWLEGKVHVLTTSSSDTNIFPEQLLTTEQSLPIDCINRLVESLVVDSQRVIVRHLPLSTDVRLDKESNDTFIRATMPYLVLVPMDVFITKGFKLMPLDELIDSDGLSTVDQQILVEAKALLRKMVASTTACLHMLPAFFSNAEILRIHKFVLGGDINRMTLHRRYRTSGYVMPIEENIDNKTKYAFGRAPDNVQTQIDGLVDFETQINPI